MLWQVHKELSGLSMPVTQVEKHFYIQKVEDTEAVTSEL